MNQLMEYCITLFELIDYYMNIPMFILILLVWLTWFFCSKKTRGSAVETVNNDGRIQTSETNNNNNLGRTKRAGRNRNKHNSTANSPAVQPPKKQDLKTNSPAIQPPKKQEPKTNSPAIQAPKKQEPKTNSPAIQAPKKQDTGATLQPPKKRTETKGKNNKSGRVINGIRVDSTNLPNGSATPGFEPPAFLDEDGDLGKTLKNGYPRRKGPDDDSLSQCSSIKSSMYTASRRSETRQSFTGSFFSTASAARSSSLSGTDDDDVDDDDARFESAVSFLKLGSKDTWYRKSISSPGILPTDSKTISKSWLRRFEGKGNSYYKALETTLDTLENLLRNEPQKYKRCTLTIQSCHKAIARVLENPGSHDEIHINGRSKIGQTFSDDEVVVKILSHQDGHRGNTSQHRQIVGEVVGLMSRKIILDGENPVFFCTMKRGDHALVKPLCKAVPKIYLQHGHDKRFARNTERKYVEVFSVTSQNTLKHERYFKLNADDLDQYVFRVVYLTWDFFGSRYPLGAVLGVLRTGTDSEGGLGLLALQHKIPSVYPPEVIEETKELLKKGLQDEGREDWRCRRTFTIDPPGSEDLDDAVSVWTEDSFHKVAVHISDVAAVVKPGTALDEELKRRGTTFYPHARKAHHMMPEPIVAELCSLLPQRDRLAITLLYTFDKNGNKTGDVEVTRTVIRSSCQLTHEKVQRVIDNEASDVDSALREDILLLHSIASKIRERRLQTAAFYIPFEDPRLSGLENNAQHKEAHSLIEELAIMTNAFVADKLVKRFPSRMLLRCHAAPPVQERSEWLKGEGPQAHLAIQLQGKSITPDSKLALDNTTLKIFTVQTTVWTQLSRYLESIQDEEAAESNDEEATMELSGMAQSPAFMDAIHPQTCLALLHWRELMLPAEYRCSHGLNEPDRLHFDLDQPAYTHFTSPIRRYADVYVHRLLLEDLGCSTEGTGINDPSDVEKLAQQLNQADKRQKAFGKACLLVKLAEDLKQQPLAFAAYVDSVDNTQMTLCIPSLLDTSAKKQVLPFAKMGVSKVPVLDSNGVEINWRKMVYSTTGTCPGSLFSVWSQLDRMQSDTMTVGRNQLSQALLVDDWLKVLKALMHKESLDVVPDPVHLDSRPSEVEYMSSEKGNGTASLLPVQYNTVFRPAQVLKVQMSSEAQNGKLELTVDLFHMAKNETICLKHIRDPTGTLTKSATISTRNKRFKTKQKYLDAWLPLLEMEACVDSGIAESGVTVQDVKVKMVNKNEGVFSLSSEFCEDRLIGFGGKLPDSLAKEGTKDRPSNDRSLPVDYLCLRYETKCSSVSLKHANKSSVHVDQKYTWLAHASVMQVSLKEDRDNAGSGTIKVKFTLCHSAPDPPDSLLKKKNGDSMTIEILPKSEVQRMAQELLLNIDSCELAEAIAYNYKDGFPPLDDDRVELGSKPEYQEVYVDSKKYNIIPLPRNNQQQKQAIQKALTNSFTLIQGPPGTGKTYTAVKLIKLFTKINTKLMEEAKGSHIVLFCGQSNKSIDHVARLLKNRLGPECPKVLRIYSSSMEQKDMNLDSARSRRGASDAKCEPDLQDISLHRIIREDGKKYAEQIAVLDRKVEQFRRQPHKISKKERKEYTRLLNKACVEEINHYEVLLTTCAVAGSQRVLEGAKGRIFQVMIDECGMCTEPDAMIPIIASKAQQVVLIGDHKQLRPIISCKEAAELGMSQSLFERLFEKLPDAHKQKLTVQYRMHPAICEFPSAEFYNKDLETALSTLWHDGQLPLPFWPRLPRGGLHALLPKADPRVLDAIPHILVDVRGKEATQPVATEEGNEGSKSNEEEADKVIEILKFLVGTCKVDPKCIRLMTQYNAQRELLQQKVKALCEDRSQNVFSRYDKTNIGISTVVSSQGNEWEYVILSLVRSLPSHSIEGHKPTIGWCQQNLGFITDHNQVNVALTRARKGLIIVGNKELLTCDEVWANLIKKYTEQNCVYNASDFPPRFLRQRSRP